MTLWVEGTANYGRARLVPAAGASNRGAIRLETSSNTDFDQGSYLDAGGAAFVNAAGGVIEARVGAGDGRSITGSITNRGTLAVDPAVNLIFIDAVSVDELGTLTRAGMGPIRLRKDLLGDTRNARQFAGGSTVIFDGGGNAGSPRLLEAMGRDRGNIANGFVDNFVIGSLSLESGTYLKLVDHSDNDGVPGREALYVNSLVVPAGTTLDLNGFQLYARALQINGTVLNGGVNEAQDGGALSLNTTAPGRIAVAGEEDRWTFFGRAGQTVLVNVNPGNGNPQPFPPRLNFAQVRVLDPSGAVIASASNVNAGDVIRITGVALPADGTYTLVVRASAAQASSTGRYTIGAFDATIRVNPLTFNQQYVSTLPNPYSFDQWTFSSPAGQQVRLRLLNASSPSIKFTLTDPAGRILFNDLTADSELVTLTEPGPYTLLVSALGGQEGSYAFRLDETTQTPLTLGTPYSGTLTGKGHAQLFRVEVPVGQTLSFELDDSSSSSSNRNELYARFGSPPTRSTFDHGSTAPGGDKSLLVPYGAPGTWYVLLYGENVSAASPFTLVAQASPVKLTDAFPSRAGNTVPATLTLTGAGFLPGTAVALVASDGATAYAPTSVSINGYGQITATFPTTVPIGTYSVRVSRGGGVATLPGAFQIIPAGQPRLETKLIMPPALRRNGTATLYVEYANTGDAAMPAPLLVVQSADLDGSDKPILSLDGSRVVENFWTGGLAPRTGHSVLILGNGRQPGLLSPGERIRVPVHFLGLLPPWDGNDGRVELEVRYWTESDTAPMDWAGRQEALRPPEVDAQAWAAVYANLTAGLVTSGDYVRMLNQNARYLAGLGRNVTAVDELWGFEVRQAYGYSAVPTLDSAVDAALPTPGVALEFSRTFENTIPSRYLNSPLGQGWFSPWLARLRVELRGTVELVGIAYASSLTTYQRDSRNGGYFSPPGDGSTLVHVGGGAYELRAVDGTVTRFRPGGQIDFVRDANGNQVTAAYDFLFNRLTSLTHSNGARLTLNYNTAGLITRVTDSAGRVTTYGYDPSNTYLTTVTAPDGKVTRYGYQASGTPQLRHALLSVERGGTTRSFAYDDRGRLSGTSLTGGAQAVSFAHDDTGLVTAFDAAGSVRLYFDQRGLLAKATDALGNTTTNEYDANGRLIRTVAPTGEGQTYTWCDCGSPTSITDELRNTTRFAYDNPLRRLTSFTDAKGNTTRYTYDARGNLLETIYPDGSIERNSNVSATGLPQTYTNRRGQPLNYAYNAAGQVTSQTFADGSVITFEYDGRGNLTRTVDGADVTIYAYNLANDGDRLKRVTYPNGRFLDYTYDTFGRRVQMVDQDGFATRYEYDAAGRLYRLRDRSDAILVTYTYDAAGRLSRVDKGNGTFTTYEYDAAGQLLSLKNWRNATVLSSRFDYTYDSRGRRTTMGTLDGTWTYTYDPTGQLTRAVFVSLNTAVISNKDLQYFYDAVGNRTRTVENGVTTVYVTNNLNQYTSVGGVAQRYDADGNLTINGDIIYEYDQLSRLRRTSGPSGDREFEYDALGIMASLAIGGILTQFLFDFVGGSAAVAEFGDGASTYNYYGLGLASRQSESGSYWYDFSGDGSVSHLNADGINPVNTYIYDPFGNQLASSGTATNPFTFGGLTGLFKLESGDFISPAGIYRPSTGAFHTERDQNSLQVIGGLQPLINFNAWALDYSAARFVNDSRRYGLDTVAFTEFRVKPLESLSKGLNFLGLGLDLYSGYKTGDYTDALISAVGMVGSWAWKAGSPLISAAQFNYSLLKYIIDNERQIMEWGDRNPWLGDQLLKLKDFFRDGLFGWFGFTDIFGGFDPNQKLPGTGFGVQRYVTSDATIPYRIDFENYGPGSKMPDGSPAPQSRWATAPAQGVTIEDTLSPDLDWGTFRLTEVGWGDFRLAVPPESTSYQGRTRMTYRGVAFEVWVDAGIDLANGKIFARFLSVDPLSQLPPDALTGFLPPEDGTGRGQGFVSYTVRPRAGLATGQEVRNVALITFDGQLAISTDQVDPLDPSKGTDPARQALVTIDAGAPSSRISTLPAATHTPRIQLAWTGQDDAGGSGVGSYDVYVSENGGPYAPFLTNTTATTATFSGRPRQSYSFYTIARDNAGNVEPAPTTPDATTRVVIPPIADFDADDRTDIGVYSPATAAWVVRNVLNTPFGWAGVDIPLPGDYDGDGDADIAVYRPTTAQWFVRGSAPISFGWAGVDIPVPADYDGDGKTDLAVYRPTTAQWFVRGSAPVSFGWAGVDMPMPADFDGDGKADIAVYRQTNATWYVRGMGNTPFGWAGVDIPVPADYDGDGKTDIAVYRPTTAQWFVRGASPVSFGWAGVDIPVPGDYDGDGDADIAVYRPTDGRWFIRGGGNFTLGSANVDIPLTQPLVLRLNGTLDVNRMRTLQRWNGWGGGSVQSASRTAGAAVAIAATPPQPADALPTVALQTTPRPWRKSREALLRQHTSAMRRVASLPRSGAMLARTAIPAGPRRFLRPISSWITHE